MGKVLQFRQTVQPRPAEESAGERSASLEVPVLTQPLRERLSGSVQGADDAEVQRRALELNPMRLLVKQRCVECQHAWQAPAAGACPKCGGTETVVVGAQPCMALRV